MTDSSPSATAATLAQPTAATLSVIPPVMPMPGIAHGVFQPSILVRLALPATMPADWAVVDAALAQCIAPAQPLPLGEVGPLSHPLAQRVAQWAASVQAAAGLPVFEPGRLVGLAPDVQAPTTAMVAVPYAPGRATPATAAIKWAVQSLQAVLAAPADAQGVEHAQQAAQTLIQSLRGVAPTSRNTLLLLRAAREVGIPWSVVAEQTYQVGIGARSRWLDSTFTDRTGRVGAELARNKVAAAAVLRRAGLPVAPHALPASEEAAVRIAQELGYPVVVKPANLDQGIAVFPRLKDESAVREAYHAVLQRSPHVLVEKHIEGRDYRLEVLDGELNWAVERVPGGVTGDGTRSVRALLDELNADPRRGRAFTDMLKPVDLDEEALALLGERGLDADAVLPAGEFLALRTAANTSRGGMPVAVLDQVHPDNRRLAEDAAKALRLDLAGIDLLLPDITRSWLETGGVICEVNAQPALGNVADPRRFHNLLERMLPERGRIPIVLVVGEALAAEVATRLGRVGAAHGLRMGLVTPHGAWIGDRQVAPAGSNLFAAAQVLVASTEVQGIVLAVSDNSAVQTGLPFDRYDVLVLAQAPAGLPDPATAYRQLLGAVAPHLSRTVVANVDDEASLALAGSLRTMPMVLASARPESTHVQHFLGSGGNAVWLKPDIEGMQIMAGTSNRATVVGTAPALIDAQTGESLRADMLTAAVALALGWPRDALKAGLERAAAN